jgi:predicted short-subunit dehydrogenase-like oxidoreductase (DUF2520 family)
VKFLAPGVYRYVTFLHRFTVDRFDITCLHSVTACRTFSSRSMRRMSSVSSTSW